jgi:molecular chaperone HscA
VTPLSLGIETMGGLVEKIIPRNSTIPVARAQEFTTFKDGQTALAVHVVQGERELVSDCRSLARFELRGIPPMAAGAARIRVTYQVDADGLLAVAAREMRSGVEASITVKPSYGLADDQVARMLQDSYTSASSDMQMRALREEQVEAERILLATQSALDSDTDLLSPDEQATIAAQLQLVRDAVAMSNDTTLEPGLRQNVVHDAVQALAHGTEEFAARRMDKSVRKALSGKSLDEI